MVIYVPGNYVDYQDYNGLQILSMQSNLFQTCLFGVLDPYLTTPTVNHTPLKYRCYVWDE